MGIENITYTLSNINALLGSSANYAQERSEGVETGNALFNFGLNVVNGTARNKIAHEMANYGNYTGYLVNGLAGYGNQEANEKGTMGLMMANMPPLFGFGYPMIGSGMFGGGMFGSGMFNNGMLGSGMFCNHNFYY